MKKTILSAILCLSIGNNVFANTTQEPNFNPAEIMSMANNLQAKASKYKDDAQNAKEHKPQQIITQAEAQNYQKQLDDKAKIYKESATNVKAVLDTKAQGYKDYAKHIQKVANNKLLKPISQGDQPGQMMIFVTLDMPTQSLAEIVQQANKYNIPVLLRGLYKNTYKDTVERIQDVLTTIDRDHPVGGFSIDPNWFEAYKITKVPAFVLTGNLAQCDTQDISNCKIPDYDVLYGNITVKSALEQFENRGEYGSLARKILAEGNVDA